MEAVLLGLCFGSCLKGEGNSNELYEALEVERSASTEDIRQAFRKKTLQLHPDKLAQRGKQVTVEDSARFVKAKEAFDILSDSKRRKRYDQIGLLGLKLIENPREMNPSELIKNFKRNQTDRLKVAVFLGLVFLIILIFPVIFALKCDNLLGYSPWTLIWVPIWIVDFLLLIAACLLCGASNELDDDDNEPIEHVTVTTKVINFLETVMFILIQIFTLMRLDKDISWSWAATFSPWYAYEFFGICSLIGPALQVLVIPRGDASVVQLEDGAEVDPNLVEQVQYFEKLVNKISSNVQIVCSLIRLWQAIFLAIKLDNGSWNWGLVLLPTWAYFAFQLMVSQYYKCVSKRLVNGLSLTEIQMQLQSGTDIHPLSSLKYQQYEQLSATGTTVVCAQIVPLFVALMLVCRLEVSDYSTFLIILPAFLIVGCCCLCSMCCVVFLPTLLGEEPEIPIDPPPPAHRENDDEEDTLAHLKATIDPNNDKNDRTTLNGIFAANDRETVDLVAVSHVPEQVEDIEAPPLRKASFTDDLD